MLKIAAISNFVISLGHIVCLFFLESAFRYVGMEKMMNDMSAIHPFFPFIITIGVAVVFFIFGLYALSADGVIRRLPLLKIGIYLIAIIFLARGVMGFLGITILIWARGITNIVEVEVAVLFEVVVSIVAIIIGLLYLIGGYKRLSINTSK